MNKKQLNALMNNPLIANLLQDAQVTGAYIKSFALTYLGEYNEKGEQIRKGDRDYIFEKLDELEKKIDKILEMLEQ